jgi:hypothetical protein
MGWICTFVSPLCLHEHIMGWSLLYSPKTQHDAKFCYYITNQ